MSKENTKIVKDNDPRWLAYLDQMKNEFDLTEEDLMSNMDLEKRLMEAKDISDAMNILKSEKYTENKVAFLTVLYFGKYMNTLTELYKLEDSIKPKEDDKS